MRDIRIDRARALKAAATAGLALLAISTLPGLLTPPKPPPPPADVGFAPGEVRAGPVLVPPSPPADSSETATRSRKTRPAKPRSGQRGKRRSRADRPAAAASPNGPEPAPRPRILDRIPGITAHSDTGTTARPARVRCASGSFLRPGPGPGVGSGPLRRIAGVRAALVLTGGPQPGVGGQLRSHPGPVLEFGSDQVDVGHLLVDPVARIAGEDHLAQAVGPLAALSR